MDALAGSLEAQHALRKLLRLNERQPCDAGLLAVAYVRVGNNEQVLEWLEKAALQKSNVMTTLKVDPVFDPLRGTSSFQALLRRVGLAQYRSQEAKTCSISWGT